MSENKFDKETTYISHLEHCEDHVVHYAYVRRESVQNRSLGILFEIDNVCVEHSLRYAVMQPPVDAHEDLVGEELANEGTQQGKHNYRAQNHVVPEGLILFLCFAYGFAFV